MKKPKHITLWLIALAVTVALCLLLFFRSSLVENVKRESARLFEYEYIPNQHIDIDSCEAAAAADSIYKDFRKKFRFHFQTIGLASFADSSRMILLSDIPPHFETDSIQPIFSKFTHRMESRRHQIGYDGYVTDIIILLGNATSENCDNLFRRLSRELFFSEYKPSVMTLPAEHKRGYFVKENIDYQITLDEFNTWFIEENEGFIRLDDTNKVFTVSELLIQKEYGVFFSQQPGFVAWSLPKNSDLATDSIKQSNTQAITQSNTQAITQSNTQAISQSSIQAIRQFTLDADLILGAIADSNTLVIIGRERQSPLYELPPLQIESILLLASVSEKELSQSLDINDLMAGKMNNGKDWCPTYLSRELENTEFGDLMTITDVLLKDWSERGTIQEGYYRYPEPGYYPFNKPLFRKLGLNELVYNWNTAGAMYAIDCENVPMPDCVSADASTTQTINHSSNLVSPLSYHWSQVTGHDSSINDSKFKIQNSKLTIYTLGRTGSLPVSYFNSQERSQSIGYRYESQAYHYFATLGNTDLARVVQYTALYQLFIDNNITYSGNTYPSFPKNKPFLLFKPTTDFLNKIRQLDGDGISLLADSLSQRSFRCFQKEKVDKQLRENERDHNFTYTEENIDFIYKDVHRSTKAGISRSIQEVKNMLDGLSDEQFKKLARYLSYPRGVTVNNQESYNTYLRARRVNQMMREIGKNNLDLLDMDLGDVKNWYAASLSGNSGRYMKTSSLIVTFNDLLTTGGHNLSSKISRVKSMTNYKRSRGNYTPTDYVQPSDTEPVAKNDSPSEPKPVATPTSHNSTPKTAKKSTPTAKATGKTSAKASNTKTTKPSGSGHNVRSRSSVISNAPRPQRGL